jgi:hypothetical protein
LKDPKIRSTGGVASDDRYAQSLRLTVNSLSGTLTQDEFVSGDTSGAKGRVIYFANTNLAGTAGVIHLTYPSGSFSSSENLTANTSGVTAVLQSVQQPDLVPFSGRMLYKVTQAPIERDVDQTENFTITVKF